MEDYVDYMPQSSWPNDLEMDPNTLNLTYRLYYIIYILYIYIYIYYIILYYIYILYYIIYIYYIYILLHKNGNILWLFWGQTLTLSASGSVVSPSGSVSVCASVIEQTLPEVIFQKQTVYLPGTGYRICRHAAAGWLMSLLFKSWWLKLVQHQVNPQTQVG